MSQPIDSSQPCSYPEYLGQRKTTWIHPEEVLAYFSKTNPNLTYDKFMAEQADDYSHIQESLLED